MASDQDSPMETTNPSSSPKNVYKDPDDGRQRLLLELEFVQCLANPTYIHFCSCIWLKIGILKMKRLLDWIPEISSVLAKARIH
ncbi:Mediator of RNA polymerase II transcription subunit 31 [Castilleja foliolosa]|uniref:Mediator of RNA polymerase II transcription subunit 31 n=1 Tax=Castilleja foliolosa TaxID=1961234 RepID=A0ABD3EH03_9LAMI